ncbi:hypothetical protein TKK_0006389 [Trichogramma kaykai]
MSKNLLAEGRVNIEDRLCQNKFAIINFSFPFQPQQQHQQLRPPSISMGPSSGSKQYDPLEELDQMESPKHGKSTTGQADAKKQQDKQADKNKANNSGSSWFGGLFSKLAPKPKNQMILPDDSNPTIVWDPVLKKWTNTEEGESEGASSLPPPPKMSELPGFKPASNPLNSAPSSGPSSLPPTVTPGLASIPPAATSSPGISSPSSNADDIMNSTRVISGGGNIYKLSRGRNMRANYVDVMNPNKSSVTLASSTPAGSPAAPTPQLFIPLAVNDPNAPVDFLSPSTAPAQPNDNAQPSLSRWSSASSLSREVQSYTMRDSRHLQREKGPMMYNPESMKDRSQKTHQVRSRYPPR